MKLLATSTSYIAPRNLVWKKLYENYDFSIASFGNWANDLIKTDNNTIIILVLFLEDLLNLDDITAKNQKKNLLGALDLIILRLKNTNKPLICSTIYLENFNFLNHTKNISDFKKLFLWFLGN